MPIGRQDWLALFLELTNEASVVAQALDDSFLSAVAGAAALAAGQRLGLSDQQVLQMQSDMFDARMGGPPGFRVVPDLEGPSTARAVAIKLRPPVLHQATDHRAGSRMRTRSRRP